MINSGDHSGRPVELEEPIPLSCNTQTDGCIGDGCGQCCWHIQNTEIRGCEHTTLETCGNYGTQRTFTPGKDCSGDFNPACGLGSCCATFEGYENCSLMSDAECGNIMGEWHEGIACGQSPCCSNNTEDLCISPCCAPIACCKDGRCIGDSQGNGTEDLPPISKVICERVYGGNVFEGTCGNVDCCNKTTYMGACCVGDFDSPSCEVMTNHECKSSAGYFMGPNTACEGEEAVNCCGQTPGCCCLLDGTTELLSLSGCNALGGSFHGEGTICCTSEPTGACCFDAGLCSVITSRACELVFGIYNGDNSSCESNC